MNKKIINLGIGITLAAVVVIMFNSFLKTTVEKYREELLRKDEVPIVVAAVDIFKGTEITQHHIRIVNKKQGLVEADPITSVDSAIGKVAAQDILKGDQLTYRKILLAQRLGAFSSFTPKGKRAMTIPVDKISSINGMISPKDHIDMLGIFPFSAGDGHTQNIVVPMFEDIEVLAVDTAITGTFNSSKGVPSTLTLALDPEQANVLTYAMEIGQIRVLLRSPNDNQKLSLDFLTIDRLWEKLLNLKKFSPPPEPPKPEIEVYSGGERTSRTLEKE